ncbi:MAG TPA: cystathionine beta-lyase, partial [Burkholderiaceae bacterium]|nr:cystathionine beta-lyase [Burkholderiaceae bacterium]
RRAKMQPHGQGIGLTMASDRPETRLAQGGKTAVPSHDFVNPPIVRGSTVLHASVADMKERSRRYRTDEPGAVNYGLYGTPTHHALFELLSELEGGYRSWAVPSGLAACTIAMLAFARAGDHVLVSDAAYGPTRRFCIEMLPRYGVQCSFYAPAAGRELAAQFRPNTRLLWLETPGSLTFEVQDVPALAELARARGVMTILDNTWATPLYFQPLKCGVDVSVHAATKYICGHSDMLMGTITCTQAAWPAMRETLFNFGLTVSPDDAYLALRGLRSLSARLRQHRATAERLIEWLLAQPEVERILYPPLPSDPGHALWKRDMSGASGLFGIVLQPEVGETRLNAMIDAVELFGRGYSWGGFESLMIPVYPQRSVAPCPYDGRLFRISAGLEDANDLIDDLKRGFASLRAG